LVVKVVVVLQIPQMLDEKNEIRRKWGWQSQWMLN